METTLSHYGHWIAVAVFGLLYAIMLAFVPFHKKSQMKPSSAYLAFVVAFVLEMFGVPLSMFFVTWAFGITLPDGVLWGHTFIRQIGHLGFYIAMGLTALGVVLIIAGWNRIYRKYWRKSEGTGQMVTDGIYRYIRHPQYTGFLLITIGMIFEWATIPLLLMWPVLAVIYYRLARREEADMEREFGDTYREYKSRTAMFFPLRFGARGSNVHHRDTETRRSKSTL